MKKSLRVILWSSFFASLAGGLFGPLYAVFVEEIGGDLLTAGSAYAAYSIASGTLIYFLGKWEDHVKHQEKLILAARILLVIGFGGYLLIESPVHLFIVQIVFGISDAIGLPAMESLYSKNLTKKKYASQWGTWESMYAIVVGIAAIAGGFLAREYGFKILFMIMFVFSTFSLIASLFLFKEIKKAFK